MNPYEAKEAIQNNTIIEFVWDEGLWGTLESLSDDETCAYYRRLGMGLFHGCTTLDQIKLPLDNKN